MKGWERVIRLIGGAIHPTDSLKQSRAKLSLGLEIVSSGDSAAEISSNWELKRRAHPNNLFEKVPSK